MTDVKQVRGNGYSREDVSVLSTLKVIVDPEGHCRRSNVPGKMQSIGCYGCEGNGKNKRSVRLKSADVDLSV